MTHSRSGRMGMVTLADDEEPPFLLLSLGANPVNVV